MTELTHDYNIHYFRRGTELADQWDEEFLGQMTFKGEEAVYTKY